MALTSTQCQTLATHIQNNTAQAVIDALAAGDNSAIQAWYNAIAAPDFWVFLSAVDVDAIYAAMDWGTDYAAYDIKGLSALQLLTRNGSYNPVPDNAREALNQIFAGATSTKNAVLAVSTKKATEGEKVFAVTANPPGGGDGSAQAQSAIAVFEGELSLSDIQCAVALIP